MKEQLQLIINAIEDKKGEDIQIYSFNTINPFIDAMIITSADNITQVNAIANNIKEEANANGLCVRGFEGNRDSKWRLVDLDTVVVHIFLDTERELYQLDRLYSKLEKIIIDQNV